MGAVAINRGVVRVEERKVFAVAVLAMGAFTGVANGALLSPLLVAISKDFHVSQSAAGQLGAVSALSAMCFALLAAPWMNRFSARRWLRLQVPVVALAAVLSALSPSFAGLVVARSLAGIGGALILATCMSAAGELYDDPVKSGRAVGVIVSATTLAIVAGVPAFAQIESALNWRWAVLALLIPLALLFLGAGILPASRPGTTPSSPLGLQGYLRVLRESRIRWLLGTMVVYAIVYYGWLIYFSAYVRTEFLVGASTLTLLFLASGGAEMITTNLSPELLRRVNPRTAFTATALVWALSLIGTGIFYTTVWSLFFSITITGAAACVLYMAIYVRALDLEPGVRGTVLSLISASSGLGSAIGAVVGGVALSAFGDYESVYRVLGLILIASIATFAMSERVAAPVPVRARRANVSSASAAS